MYPVHCGLCLCSAVQADRDRIPGIDQEVGDNDSFRFGDYSVQVFDTPGHTRGHITYYVPDADALFPGEGGSSNQAVQQGVNQNVVLAEREAGRC